MPKHDLTHLEKKVEALRTSLASAADKGGLDEFLVMIHRPGFTTPAELFLFEAVVDSMIEQSNALLGLKKVLLTGAGRVELNPQPLPP